VLLHTTTQLILGGGFCLPRGGCEQGKCLVVPFPLCRLTNAPPALPPPDSLP